MNETDELIQARDDSEAGDTFVLNTLSELRRHLYDYVLSQETDKASICASTVSTSFDAASSTWCTK